MQSSGEFIIHNIKAMFNNTRNIFVAPDIPEKKLNNASKTFKVDRQNILALYDNTFFGGGDEGIVFTSEKVVFRAMLSDIREICYKDMKSIEIVLKPNKKDKPPTKVISIKTINDELIIEYCIANEDLELFVNFIKKLLEECDTQNFTNESISDLFKPLEDMSKELRLAFVKIVINMSFENDKEIDNKERSEIMLLTNRIGLEREERFKILEYMAEIENKHIAVKELVEVIKNNCEKEINYKAVMISLVQNLFYLYANTQLKKQGVIFNLPHTFDFLEKHKYVFGLSNDEIDLAKSAVENDLKILNEDIDSDKVKEITKDLAAKAASVGLPIGAVYVSGSVAGLSAAGMTSGLATLGMGGLLGLSSMATGIGVAVLLGVGVYQGIKYFTTDNKQLEALKQREMMIQEVLKQTQKTISSMIEDINIIVQKLNNLILNDNEKGQTIEKLKKMIFLYTGAMSKTNEKYEQYENIKSRIECPKILDISRINHLKDENKEAYNFIVSCYEDSKEKKDKETKEDIENIHMKLKQDIPTEKLENLAEILKGIGYFSTKNIIKDKVKGLFK